MIRSSLVHCALVIALVAGSTVRPGNAQSATVSPPLSLEEVVKDWKSSIPEELIITKIRRNGKAFNLSGEEIQELTNSGISATVVKFLLDPSQPYAPPAPPAPPTPAGPSPAGIPDVRPPARTYPADPYASRVPSDPGLYHFVDGVPTKSDLKLLLGENQGAGITKVLMKKGKAIGYLLGPNAKTRIKEPAPVFYMRLPEGKAIEEVVLLALEQMKERREIEIGRKLDKPELKAESMRPFDSLEVGPRLFKITEMKSLVKGEYLFLLLGSAEPPKGSYGKVYDFAIEEPARR